MMSYKKLNNIIGWLVFAISAYVYLITCEPTVSWWDCGEYIATSSKLEIGHPPGAPLFLMMGRFFAMFASAPEKIAYMVNAMSAMASAFTILFLFWSITALAKKVALKSGEMNTEKMIAVFGSAIVGSLAYTFSDSFWFSAVEGEVYATSSFFTAIVFWAMLKWEEEADDKNANRWIVLIAYLMGLSIGVHLLNLLAIPAIGMIYYYKKYKPTTKGAIIAFLVSAGILGFVQYGVIAGFVNFAGYFELFFVNSLGMPFNSGLYFYIITVIALIAFLLLYFKKHQRSIAYLVTLSLSFLFIGYSSYALIIIRSSANPPMDENNPQDIFSLLSYLNREQYGDRPLLYGQYYNADVQRDEVGNPVVKDDGPVYKQIDGKYKIVDTKKSYKFESANSGFFPRMYSNQPDHIEAYKDWAGVKTAGRPSFGENLTFFFRYQVGWMYFRYFMWNFAGRQNDVQGHGNVLEGNWISGIPFVDNARLGDQSNLPKSMKDNRGRNVYYLLPLLLGFLGMYFHFVKHKNDAIIVAILFFMTGLAIIIYLNQYPFQPRERDYAYAGSFYAFAIWIGLGVMAIHDALKKYAPATLSAALVSALCLVAVPGLMAKENWDDHDRSKKTAAHDIANNYLQSCAPNAILFTNGDNDTFPLWYLQEVEGVRTDVRVANYTLLGGDWHIHQMFQKAYESDPLPLNLKKEQYNQGTNDFIRFNDEGIPGYIDLKEVVDFVAKRSYLPTQRFFIPVDKNKVIKNGTVKMKDGLYIPENLSWELKQDYLYKHEFMIYDLLAHFNWDRPIYFASPQSVRDIFPLEQFCKMEGFASRLVPALDTMNPMANSFNTDIMYDNMMNKFKWGNLNDPHVYVDPESFRMVMISRSIFGQFANALISEKKFDKAKKILNRCVEVFPHEKIMFDYYMVPIAEAYYTVGENKKGNDVASKIADRSLEDLKFYMQLMNNKHGNDMLDNIKRSYASVYSLLEIAKKYKQDAWVKKYQPQLDALSKSIEWMMR